MSKKIKAVSTIRYYFMGDVINKVHAVTGVTTLNNQKSKIYYKLHNKELANVSIEIKMMYHHEVALVAPTIQF